MLNKKNINVKITLEPRDVATLHNDSQSEIIKIENKFNIRILVGRQTLDDCK